MIEVDRDELVGHVLQDALQLLFRGVLHRLVDLLGRRLAARYELQIDDGDVRRRHADRRAVELALELGQDEADGSRRSRRGRDHRQRGGARAPHVLVRLVEDALVVGVGVDRRHEARLDADEVVQDLGDGREAVGRARGVRDDLVVAVILSWLTP